MTRLERALGLDSDAIARLGDHITGLELVSLVREDPSARLVDRVAKRVQHELARLLLQQLLDARISEGVIDLGKLTQA